MPLNAQSPIPLYRQLADRLTLDIESGVHEVASKIPSEHELADRYDIGRPTVRQATDMLVRQGRLERRRGSGTFVLPPTQSIDLFSLAGTSAALRKSGVDAQLKLTASPSIEPAQQVAGGDKMPADRLRIERVAVVNEKPVLFEILRFDIELFPGLEQQALEARSLSALVRDVYFLEPTAADQTFFAVTADKTQSQRLNISTGTPLLRVVRELHFGESRCGLLAEIICPTDQFEFSQTLFPVQLSADTEAVNLESNT